MTENQLREDVAELVDPDSMPTETIDDDHSSHYFRHEVQLEVIDMIIEDDPEEHLEFEDVYRVLAHAEQ